MWKFLVLGTLGALGALQAGGAHGGSLSALERRWLSDIEPVLAFARATGYPLTVVVQPQPTPGLTPMGMAVEDGRCTLVLSMRGNPKVADLLDRVEPDLMNATLELMAAHELAHCQRHLDGRFASLPANFTAEQLPQNWSSEKPRACHHSSMVWREEGYSDLVGLAWTRLRHPALYARLHAWLVDLRSNDATRHSDHDTTMWLKLVQNGNVLADPALFANAEAIWARGLADEN